MYIFDGSGFAKYEKNVMATDHSAILALTNNFLFLGFFGLGVAALFYLATFTTL